MAFNLYFAGQQAKEVDQHLQKKNCLRLFSQANERAGIADWQTSGYAKNLFTVRSKKSDYVISKTITCFVAGASMIVAFFIGSMNTGIEEPMDSPMVNGMAGQQHLNP